MSASRSRTTVRCPASRNALVIAVPIAPAPPVTTAIRPRSESSAVVMVSYREALLLFQQAVGEDDLDDRRDRVLAGPVALQLAGERDPADRLPAGLHHALQAGAVGLGR